MSNIEELRVDTNYTNRATKMHPVMSIANKVVCWVSEDECTLCFDVGDAFGGRRLRRPIRYYSAEERAEMIHAYLKNNLPPFYDKVNTLILKMGRFVETERFAIDAVKLKELFPNLGSVYCKDIYNYVKENNCGCCEDIDGTPLSEMIAEEIIKWALIPKLPSFLLDEYVLPDDLKKFFDGKR